MTLPLAAAVRPEVELIVRWELGALFLAAGLTVAWEMLGRMRQLCRLQMLFTEADAPDLPQNVLERIRADAHHLVEPRAEHDLLPPGPRSAENPRS